MKKVDEAILYVVGKLERSRVKVGRTRIMKVLYLADLIAKSRLGRKITDAEYRYYFYGPYSREITNALNKLVERGYLADNSELTKFGFAHDYKITGLVSKIEFKHLQDEEIKILNEVIRKFGKHELFRLLDIVYSTDPMRNAVPGEVLLM